MTTNSTTFDSNKWSLKRFEELSNQELYHIIRLRNAIFIVEQNCVFEDLDGKDLSQCYHLFYSIDEKVIAYARIFEPDVFYPQVCISRVCTSPNYRGNGIGRELMQAALEQTSTLFPETSIRIEAQLYLQNFYESLGFKTIGDVYLEDGIKHIPMLKQNQSQ